MRCLHNSLLIAYSDTDYPAFSTPQNTPAATAPITSRAQQPGVASIKEGKSNLDNGCKLCVSNLVSVM